MGLYQSIRKAIMQFKVLPLELFCPGKCLYIAGDLHLSKTALNFFNHNLGDDLNIPLVSALSGKHVIPFRYSFLGKKRDRHLVIGSMIDAWSSPRSIIWGAGLIKPLSSSIPIPKAIFAVRGPMTRNELLKCGIACPEVYGDPAILMPEIFSPQTTRRCGMALIPHISDMEHPFVSQWRSRGGKVLDVSQYGDWRQFIVELNACEAVLSSSLHGLILADAYNVPSQRLLLGNKLIGGDFKFLDYYLSFLKNAPVALRVEDVADESEAGILDKIVASWHPLPKELKKELLECCPFLRLKGETT